MQEQLLQRHSKVLQERLVHSKDQADSTCVQLGELACERTNLVALACSKDHKDRSKEQEQVHSKELVQLVQPEQVLALWVRHR